jgi:hypothetical protein
MRRTGTPWPVPTRVSYILAFEEPHRRHHRLSARRFCEATEVPCPTFARWWAGWCRQGKKGLLGRAKRPRHRPDALQGRVPDIIRQVSRPACPGRPPPPRLPHPGRPHPLQPEQGLPRPQAGRCPRPPSPQAQAGVDPLCQASPRRARPDGAHVPPRRSLPAHPGG